MLAVIVMSAILLLLVTAFAGFFFYSRTPEWGDSEFRRSALRLLVIVGPLLGMHYKPPRPVPPAVTAPGPEEGARATSDAVDPGPIKPASTRPWRDARLDRDERVAGSGGDRQ